MSAAGQRESFELADKAVVADPGGPIMTTETKPDFFATAEGFYDYTNFRYIYQYKDHLGNTRLNFGRDENGVLFTEDSNDYYPFGLNFINPVSKGAAQLYNPSATYKNYKYQGQELQETGFYQFKWRQYMPDVARFFNVDPLAEDYPHNSTYAFSENRVIDNIELEGLEGEDFRFRLNQRLKGGVQARVEASAQKDASDSFMAVIRTVTPIEDVYSLFSGKDFDGNAVSMGDALSMLSVSLIPEVGTVEKGVVKAAAKAEASATTKAEARAAKLNKTPREGKDFTKAGKETVKDLNKAKNDGKMICESCKTEAFPGTKSQKGVRPPDNEAQVDHIKRKREGGSGTPDNGQVLCRKCNLDKH